MRRTFDTDELDERRRRVAEAERAELTPESRRLVIACRVAAVAYIALSIAIGFYVFFRIGL